MSAATCYADALRNFPATGEGCHCALLSVANIGALAEKSPEEVFRDLRARAHGKRLVPDSEIRAAVNKAFRDAKCGGSFAMSAPRPPPAFDPAKMLRGILATGDGAGVADLWENSPIRVDWKPELDPARLLALLYVSEDKLFIGARHDTGPEHVKTAADWRARFEAGVPVPEHIIPNPLTGEQGQTKEGQPSFRSDSCVAKFSFALLEFDTTPESLRKPGQTADAWPRETQCQFWAGALAFNWPIAALIDSGNTSIHAWLAVNAADVASWEKQVECELFARRLVPLGVDRACRNEARLSRMPGHFRAEKSRWQRILYLNPQAGNEATS